MKQLLWHILQRYLVRSINALGDSPHLRSGGIAIRMASAGRVVFLTEPDLVPSGVPPTRRHCGAPYRRASGASSPEALVSNHNGGVSFIIRYAALSDMEELQGVFRRASLSNEDDREHLLAHPESLVLADDGVREHRRRVAADSSGSIVGFASFLISGNAAELEDLFVDPPWMRRGVGEALVLDISTLVRELQFEELEVTANPHAMAFYEHVGFVIDHVVDTQFYEAPRMRRGTD
jgi:GNAT superfamily N-acetyltransferase